jgi:DNA-binding response OmpR family regulator
MNKKHIVLVGDLHTVEPFILHLTREGVDVVHIENIRHVLEKVVEVKPDAIVFILPRYWDDITIFVDNLRAKEDFVETPILYVGSLIEGEDQRVLHQKGVKTLTLGPLMPQEVVRYILNMLK